jgi:DUF971 family protein
VLVCLVLIKKYEIDIIFTVPHRGELFVAAYLAHLLSKKKTEFLKFLQRLTFSFSRFRFNQNSGTSSPCRF